MAITPAASRNQEGAAMIEICTILIFGSCAV